MRGKSQKLLAKFWYPLHLGSMSIPQPNNAPTSSEKTLGERELIVLMALLMSLQAFGIDAMLPALGAMANDFGVPGNE